MARLLREPVSRRRPREKLKAAKVSVLTVATDAIACAQRLRMTLRGLLMRPDHIFIAMTMIKHGTLACACIYAYKIVHFLVKTM